MTDKYPPAVQRPALLKLVEALGCRDAALRRDECGDWRINGKYGCIYAVPGMTVHGLPPGEGFQIYYRGAGEFEEPSTSRGWTFAKEAMSFAKVTQEGDMEGLLFLDRLPTPPEAEIIRDKLWIAKKRELGEEDLARLRRQGYRTGGVKTEPTTRYDGLEG
jgi:hypothetical protein